MESEETGYTKEDIEQMRGIIASYYQLLEILARGNMNEYKNIVKQARKIIDAMSEPVILDINGEVLNG